MDNDTNTNRYPGYDELRAKVVGRTASYPKISSDRVAPYTGVVEELLQQGANYLLLINTGNGFEVTGIANVALKD